MQLSEQLLQLRDKLLTIPHFEDTYKEAIREGGVFDKLLGIWERECEIYKSTKATIFPMMYATAPHATAKLLVVAYAINNPEKFFDTPEQADEAIGKEINLSRVASFDPLKGYAQQPEQ